MALFQERWQREEERIRHDAASRSRAVVVGQVTEHLIPFLPDFKYNPKDARFLGSPIDLIAFDGLDEGRLRRIVFVEVKGGKTAALSEMEKQIREAVEGRLVGWEMIRREADAA